MTPLPILKQVLQLIILIGAKIIINLLYYKVQEPARLCLGIHIKTMHYVAHRAFFITKILGKLLTWNQLATVMNTRYKRC